ncbi:MAG: hypothetical protein I3273_03170 [Candidatus Moeniiplasma glomeromycotorum]|nr:hypothetical protein [Candidatus Moeniiplasma glomeromycotorum]MCE8167545.1 hypothetical protein [Candidatus Moeniiplasma glomeromycotorum]MCE8169103.1 hypothetical protein [Candidatus Moeniiplasma glomeromycotorum]
MNQNNTNGGVTYKTQAEINKMSYNEKFLACKCGKKPEFRWIKVEKAYHEGYDEGKKGMFYPIVAYKGKKGEEVCHKCAPCAKCGKEGAYWSGRHKYEKTNDNPSGEWVLAYCSVECFNGEKPSLPKKEPREVANCDHCRKLTKVKFGNSNTGKIFCSRDCFVAAGNKIQKGKCRIAGCSQTAYYECMDLCLPHSKPCRGTGCNLALGTDEGDFCSKRCESSPKSNPAAPNSQPLTNSNDKSDNSVKVNPDNSPQPNPRKDNLSEPEIKISFNPAEEPKKNPGAERPNETKPDHNQVLVINLKDIKKISLVDDNLVIEFNQGEKAQTVVSEQITKSQEFSAVKSYLKTSGRSSVSNQELANIISQKNTDNSNSSSPTQPSKSPCLWIAGVGVIGVMMGLCYGLVVKFKKLRPKNK